MLLATFLLAIVSLAYACELPHHQHAKRNLNSTLGKRWYGVDHLTEETQYLRGPWPDVFGDGTTPIRFCFDDENSYNNLLALIQDAINLWQPAMDVSTLTIEPSCGVGNWDCICDEDTHYDTLIIGDVTDEEDGFTKATQGHQYIKREDRERQDDGRYWYNFLAVKRDEPRGFSRWWDLHAVAHELGHVAGLDHEHQRPDAAEKGFYWSCTMLNDADSVHRRIANREEGTWREGDTFQKACNDFDTAERYGFSATGVMAKPTNFLGEGVWSKDLDWGSIMIYSSYRNEKRLSEKPAGVKFPEGSWMYRRYYEGRSPRSIEILSGGITIDAATRAYDYSTVRISDGDIARIAQLYPSGEDGEPSGDHAEGWEQAE